MEPHCEMMTSEMNKKSHLRSVKLDETSAFHLWITLSAQSEQVYTAPLGVCTLPPVETFIKTIFLLIPRVGFWALTFFLFCPLPFYSACWAVCLRRSPSARHREAVTSGRGCFLHSSSSAEPSLVPTLGYVWNLWPSHKHGSVHDAAHFLPQVRNILFFRFPHWK